MMDTSRFVHLFFQHLPDFFRKSKRNNQIKTKDFLFSQDFSSQFSLFASMTNIPTNNEEHLIYDTDGCLLLMQTTQSNLSLFNISCDSLVFNDDENLNIKLNTIKHYNSSIDIHFEIKKIHHRSTMIFSEENISSHTKTLQRWQGLELLNTYA